MNVFCDILVVVKVNKIITRYTTKGDKAGEDKQHNNGEK